MIIRSLNNTELDLANELYCECFFKEKKKSNLCISDKLFGLFIDDLLIGLVQIDFINLVFEDIKIAYINSFCISKKYQHQGYGSKLLEWCINYAKEYGANRIQMSSNKNRIYAHKLYEKYGFEIIDTVLLKKDI